MVIRVSVCRFCGFWFVYIRWWIGCVGGVAGELGWLVVPAVRFSFVEGFGFSDWVLCGW